MEKEFLYKLLFETANEGLIVTNKKGEIILTNPRVEELFGYDKKELKGVLIEQLIPKKYQEKHVAHRQNFNKKPSKRMMGKNIKLFGLKKSGDEFPVEVSLNYLTLNDNFYAVALITDITDRFNAEKQIIELNASLEKKVEERTKELARSERMHKLIALNFPNGTINVFDRDLKYVYVEGQELSKLGINSKYLIGTKYLDRLDSSIKNTIENQLKQVFKGKDQMFEIEYNNKFYLINAVPLTYDEEGKIEQILVIEQNITQQKLAEIEIQKSLNKEKELNELKSRFVSMASHEFRTPLSTILSSTTLAERYNTDETKDKRLKHLNRIKSSVKNLTSILNDFLSLDKLESGAIELRPQTFKIKDLMEEIIEEMEVYLKPDQKIIFEKNIVLDEILSDRHILKNILLNLLSNASKYSDEDIYLTVKNDNDATQIEVRDKGIGIPKDEMKNLFTRFFRAKNAFNLQGTGLGLNIVKKYLELIQGEIEVKSVENEGSTFKITFTNKLKINKPLNHEENLIN